MILIKKKIETDSRHQTKRNKEISVNSKLRQTLEDLELEEQELDMKLRVSYFLWCF